MLALPLLVTTLALAPTGATSRLDLYADADYAFSSWRYPPPPGYVEIPGGHANGGGAGAGMTVYLRRVVDDDAPPTLQPFLQRLSYFNVSGGGGAYDQSNPSSFTQPSSSGRDGSVNLSAAGYPGRWLYGYARFGVEYRESDANGQKLSSSLSLPIDVAAGVRAGALRISAGWSITPLAANDNPFRVDFWGGVYVQGYGVVRKKLGLGATVQVLDGGAFVNGDATLFVARRFGFGADLHGSHSAASGLVTNRVGADVSFQAWVSARVALRFFYSFDWYHFDATGFSDEQHTYASVISLQALIRPR